jgi:hypothetical protein
VADVVDLIYSFVGAVEQFFHAGGECRLGAPSVRGTNAIRSIIIRAATAGQGVKVGKARVENEVKE